MSYVITIETKPPTQEVGATEDYAEATELFFDFRRIADELSRQDDKVRIVRLIQGDGSVIGRYDTVLDHNRRSLSCPCVRCNLIFGIDPE